MERVIVRNFYYYYCYNFISDGFKEDRYSWNCIVVAVIVESARNLDCENVNLRKFLIALFNSTGFIFLFFLFIDFHYVNLALLFSKAG